MKDRKLAVLIDAENVPNSKIKQMLDEIATYGTPTIKRIYGNWGSRGLRSWKPHLIKYAITPIQQYANVKSKNASDSTLIIDAMDILYSKRVKGFCIISSDSDFTQLAIRLRESGMFILGIGRKNTPQSLINSCTKFVSYEMLFNKTFDRIDQKLIDFLSSCIDNISDDEGWAHLGGLGGHILKKQPDFDSRIFGFEKLSKLIGAIDDFEIQKVQVGQNKNSIKLVVRKK